MGRISFIAAAAVLSLAASPANAGFLGFGAKPKPAVEAAETATDDAVIGQAQLALDEQRYGDAGEVLDRAFAAGDTDPRLMLLSGELNLARGADEDAITNFTMAQGTPALFAQASAGRGIALSRLGRDGDAIAALREATTTDTTQWRAWNALGVEYDRQKNWQQAEQAYTEALKSPKAGAMVYNNRGYSRMLQGRSTEASADFVAALDRDPGFAVARTNLRLALAIRGDYDRATAASGTEDRAAILNNAGFAALMRGDLPQAETLFTQAIAARGRFYGRAQENLELTRAMMTQAKTPGVATGQP